MKLWNWIKKCPLLFLLLAGWMGLAAFTWSEGKLDGALGYDMIEKPVFTALLEPELADSALDGEGPGIVRDGMQMLADGNGVADAWADMPGPGDGGSAAQGEMQDASDGRNGDLGEAQDGMPGGQDGSGSADAKGAGSTDKPGSPAGGKNAGNSGGGSGASGDVDADSGKTSGNKGGAGSSKASGDKGSAEGGKASGSTDAEGGKASGGTDANGGKASGSTAANSGKASGNTDANGGKASGNKGGDKSTSGDADEEIGVTRFKEYTKKKTDSPYYSDPGKKALTTDFSYRCVEKGYFDDAVFIGDSRTVGMQDYSGLDNAAFFAKTGMNVYEVLEDKFLTDPETGKETDIAHMMKTYQYGKIYFMVGINELGTGNTGTFQKAYARVLQKFRKWQPDAVIYIQGIIPVSKAKASGDDVFNNININDKNVAIAQLADGKDIFYLDVSGKLIDKKGYLKADYTFDDVHMYAQHYQKWTDYLMEHAVVR